VAPLRARLAAAGWRGGGGRPRPAATPDEPPAAGLPAPAEEPVGLPLRWAAGGAADGRAPSLPAAPPPPPPPGGAPPRAAPSAATAAAAAAAAAARPGGARANPRGLPEIRPTPHPHAPYTGAAAADGSALRLGASTNATRLTAVTARLVTLFRFRSLLAFPAGEHTPFTAALAARLQFDVPRFAYTVATDGDAAAAAAAAAAVGDAATVGAATLAAPPPALDVALVWSAGGGRGRAWEAATARRVGALRAAATRYVVLGQWPRVAGEGVVLRGGAVGRWEYASAEVRGRPFLWPAALRGVVPMADGAYHRYLTLYEVSALPDVL